MCVTAAPAAVASAPQSKLFHTRQCIRMSHRQDCDNCGKFSTFSLTGNVNDPVTTVFYITTLTLCSIVANCLPNFQKAPT